MTRTAKKNVEKIIHDLGLKRYKRCCDWKGYEVYQPVFRRTMYVGDPLVIFVSGDKAWLAPDDEGYEYIHYRRLKMEEEEKSASHN